MKGSIRIKNLKLRILCVFAAMLMSASLLSVGVYAAWPSAPRVSSGRITWSSIYFGNYDGKPIRWRILSINGNKEALLLADEAVASKPFNERTGALWQDSTIRTWLNSDEEGGFYHDAFSSDEKAAIITSTVQNIGTGMWEDFEGVKNTTDNVYLPSYSELINSSYGYPEYPVTSRSLGTDDVNVRMWLRSSGELYTGTEYAMIVMDLYNAGTLEGLFQKAPTGEEHQIYPMLRMSLSADVWTDAGTVVNNKGYITRNAPGSSSIPNTDSSEDRGFFMMLALIFGLSAMGALASYYAGRRS